MQLVIQNLSKTYPGGVRALDNISTTIPTGMFGLLGPSGAGKSRNHMIDRMPDDNLKKLRLETRANQGLR